jgi:hypothetical protein
VKITTAPKRPTTEEMNWRPNMAGKLQKTAKELTDMLWDALKRANAIGFGDYKIRVFPSAE